MNKHCAIVMSLSLGCATGHAAILTFDSSSAGNNETTRSAWLTAIGPSTPQYLVDFETGFVDGQNISGQTGLLPGGLVITDTSAAGNVPIECTANGIGNSDPVGLCAIEHNELPYLQLDFSAQPIDYLAFVNIDHGGTDGVVTFVGGGTATFDFEYATTAEFFGIFRNDMPQIVRIELDASGDGTWGLDNVEYGAVPGPASGWLMASAVIAVLGRLRRRVSRLTI